VVRRTVAAVLLAPLLAGCSEPVFVPEAGPGAPGYSESSAPPPPEVEVQRTAAAEPLPAGGFIDSVVREKGTFEVTGWALIDPEAPRGELKLVLPTGLEAKVVDVETNPRPDVVSVTGDDALIWSGFSVTVRGSLPEGKGVCMLSRSSQGAFRLGQSDEGLCPT
jgi:hypothetical protein